MLEYSKHNPKYDYLHHFSFALLINMLPTKPSRQLLPFSTKNQHCIHTTEAKYQLTLIHSSRYEYTVSFFTVGDWLEGKKWFLSPTEIIATV